MIRDFWQTKTLAEMTAEEWESLCDGCGRCCLNKLEDEDTGEILFTAVACRLLDPDSCRCSNYPERRREVPDCIDLRDGFSQWHWMPETCAYRLLTEGKPLPDWHPLVTGDATSTRKAGMGVDGIAILETDDIDPIDYVLEWLQ